MAARSPFLSTPDAPLRTRLVIAWSAFFVLVIAGIGLAAGIGRDVPALLDLLP